MTTSTNITVTVKLIAWIVDTVVGLPFCPQHIKFSVTHQKRHIQNNNSIITLFYFIWQTMKIEMCTKETTNSLIKIKSQIKMKYPKIHLNIFRSSGIIFITVNIHYTDEQNYKWISFGLSCLLHYIHANSIHFRCILSVVSST